MKPAIIKQRVATKERGDRRDISKPLVIGSIIFGIGWGIAGFCPGPAIVSIGSGQAKAIVFVIAMLAGMWICEHFFTAHKK